MGSVLFPAVELSEAAGPCPLLWPLHLTSKVIAEINRAIPPVNRTVNFFIVNVFTIRVAMLVIGYSEKNIIAML
jgi:hypothetical protein